jgi:hypothetical protein
MRALSTKRLQTKTTKVQHKETKKIGVAIDSDGSIKFKNLRYLVDFGDGNVQHVPFGLLVDLEFKAGKEVATQ